MFFDDWFGLLRVLVVGTLAYAALVGILRVTGKRTLAKMNAFDLVVTVALGSTLATVLLSEDVALAEGILAFSLLAGLQLSVAWTSVRSERFRELIKSEPRLLVSKGQILRSAMRDERLTEGEILSALRSEGYAGREEIEAVVLETDGSFSVIGTPKEGRGAALEKLGR